MVIAYWSVKFCFEDSFFFFLKLCLISKQANFLNKLAFVEFTGVSNKHRYIVISAKYSTYNKTEIHPLKLEHWLFKLMVQQSLLFQLRWIWDQTSSSVTHISLANIKQES